MAMELQTIQVPFKSINKLEFVTSTIDRKKLLTDKNLELVFKMMDRVDNREIFNK